ncbi:MAG: hypothetical protein AB7F79_13435 [Steroidobacteraceae bacterium]
MDAIESKNSKIKTYNNATGASLIWLLIHSPISGKDTTVNYQNPEIMNLMKYAANKASHQFHEIYFWDPLHGITKLFPLKNVWRQIKINFDGGYPTNEFILSTGQFKTTKIGEEPVELDYVVTPEVIIVPPQDPKYKKHSPRFKNSKLRVRIIVGATDARISTEQVDD